MSARLRGIARDTEQIVAAGGYTAPDGRWVDLAGAIAAAADGTRMFGPEPVPAGAIAPGPGVRCTVTAESSTQAARRLTGARPSGGGEGPSGGGTGPVAVLNFASARNPGGGCLGGAQAQEEALCRRPRCTPACCGHRSSTRTTAPTVTCSTATGWCTPPRCRCSGTTGTRCSPRRTAWAS